jgi:hypothetical protein
MIKLRISTIVVAAGLAVAAYSQSLPIGTSGSIPAGTLSNVHVVPAASSADQIRRAIQLEQKVYDAQQPQQKFDALAETLANLQIIPKLWPNDTTAIVRGAIMQADLGAQFGLFPNIIGSLLPIVPLVQRTALEPGVERRLGQAYEMTGNIAEGEKHLLAAERSLGSSQVDRVEVRAVLGTIAMFYSRRNQPREAIKRLHRQADLPGEDIVNRMMSQLQIVKQAVRLSDDPLHQEAKGELAAFDQLLFRARGTPLTAPDANSVEHMAQEAQRIKDRHHL